MKHERQSTSYGLDTANGVITQLQAELSRTNAMLTAKSIELQTAQSKIAQLEQQQSQPKLVHAKTGAEVRRYMEQENEREFVKTAEEVNGIR